MESSNYMIFRRIDGPLGEFIGFLPRVLWYEFQITNSRVMELFLDEFHDDF